jgi:cytochrome c550
VAYDLSLGEAVFQKLCQACHPGGGKGLGPSLAGVEREAFIKVVREGKGMMPAYSASQISDEELASLYEYTRSLFPGGK